MQFCDFAYKANRKQSKLRAVSLCSIAELGLLVAYRTEASVKKFQCVKTFSSNVVDHLSNTAQT